VAESTWATRASRRVRVALLSRLPPIEISQTCEVTAILEGYLTAAQVALRSTIFGIDFNILHMALVIWTVFAEPFSPAGSRHHRD